jgi:hypothetical protein
MKAYRSLSEQPRRSCCLGERHQPIWCTGRPNRCPIPHRMCISHFYSTRDTHHALRSRTRTAGSPLSTICWTLLTRLTSMPRAFRSRCVYLPTLPSTFQPSPSGPHRVRDRSQEDHSSLVIVPCFYRPELRRDPSCCRLYVPTRWAASERIRTHTFF